MEIKIDAFWKEYIQIYMYAFLGLYAISAMRITVEV